MRITTISLRNYRVFRELDLEMPPGLVGVYGANGAGKSTLLESILWALYGKARTGKGEIRSSGVSGECVVELGFEHESHHYLVRRSISGQNATVKARVLVGGDVVADGITDVGRYLRSTLGMDETAFRSSVFAEQKQLAAFSDQTPDQRRRLVLQLLGITPVEKARDQARADFRQHQADHARLQTLIGPFDEKVQRVTAAIDQLAAAETAALAAGHDSEASAAALHDAETALQAFADAHRQDQMIRQLGGAARKRRDEAQAAVTRLTTELASLDEVQEQLDALDALPALDVAAVERTIELLVAWRDAQHRLDELGPESADGLVVVEPDEGAVAVLRARRDALTREAGDADGSLRAADAAVKTARATLARTEEIGDADACPVCGQALREGADGVRRHREEELARAVAEQQRCRAVADAARVALHDADAAVRAAEQALAAAQAAHRAAALRADRRRVASEAVASASAAVGTRVSLADEPALRAQVRDARQRQTLQATLRERLARRPEVERELADSMSRLAAAEQERTELRAQLDALRFDATGYRSAEDAVRTAKEHHDASTARSVAAQRAAAAAQQRVVDAEEALREAKERDEQLQQLAEEARYLGRTADLLSGFRQAVVGLVGPQLSMQASELFNDFTNGEYDGLVVDPETYEIQVLDGGVAYPSNRFSGSEVDLANLALRVAISEQVRFQAGGQVGLLVLDEALASLDADRKDRMLAALTKLSGRFRQILVVTHAPEVKERLPQAIEVRHLGGRRSTAEVLDPLAGI